MKSVAGNEGEKCNYTVRLDTYGCGCQHDCSYCYAKSLLSFRNLWNPENPSVADIDQIRRKIRKIHPGEVIRLGGMTDCFQPMELIHRNTYKTIKALNRRRIGYLIVTKSAIVARDEYMKIYDPDLAHFQITVTTLDDQLSRTYEKASDPTERIQAILKLQAAGYDVSIRISPILPGYMDFEKLDGLGIQKAVVEFLRVNPWIQKWFNIDYSKYTVSQSGYKHLPLSEKLKIIEKIRPAFREISVCEDVTDHYEYWKENINPNKADCCNLRGSKNERTED